MLKIPTYSLGKLKGKVDDGNEKVENFECWEGKKLMEASHR
jgi:hypothetical protein